MVNEIPITYEAIVAAETEVMKLMNVFNNDYAMSVRCAYASTSLPGGPSSASVGPSSASVGPSSACTGGDYTKMSDSLLAQVDIIREKINILNGMIDAAKKQTPPLFIDKNTYMTTYQNILISQETNKRMRSKMDMQMRELNAEQGTAFHDNKQTLDRTMYSGMMWTVLATSLVYYLFWQIDK